MAGARARGGGRTEVLDDAVEGAAFVAGRLEAAPAKNTRGARKTSVCGVCVSDDSAHGAAGCALELASAQLPARTCARACGSGAGASARRAPRLHAFRVRARERNRCGACHVSAEARLKFSAVRGATSLKSSIFMRPASRPPMVMSKNTERERRCASASASACACGQRGRACAAHAGCARAHSGRACACSKQRAWLCTCVRACRVAHRRGCLGACAGATR
jgi:hypothetical protein